jgi:hypothetical protein
MSGQAEFVIQGQGCFFALRRNECRTPLVFTRAWEMSFSATNDVVMNSLWVVTKAAFV